MNHSSRSHALCSASTASRWIECPGSVGMSIGRDKPPSRYAKEGTTGHECAEKMIKSWMTDGQIPFELEREYGKEMFDNCLVYAEAVKNEAKLYKLGDRRISVERRGVLDDDLAMYGTLDLCMTGQVGGNQDADLYWSGSLIDFKYGKGVEVDAQDNMQLAFYAAAMMRNSDRLLAEVRCTIVQPRVENAIKTVTWSRAQLKKITERLVNAAKLATYQAATQQYTTKPGKHCRFCNAKEICLAYKVSKEEGQA